MGFFDWIGKGYKNIQHSIGNSIIGHAAHNIGFAIGYGATRGKHLVNKALEFSRERGIGSATQATGAALGLSSAALAGTGIGAVVAAPLATAGLALTGAGTLLKSAEIATDPKTTTGQKIGKLAIEGALGAGVLSSARLGKLAATGIKEVGKQGLKQYARTVAKEGTLTASQAQNIRAGISGVKKVATAAEEIGKQGMTLARTGSVVRDYTRRFN
tara:strand:- start:15 stop:659 length:645 start_codon:yes stop_codon:yes gene_type:complete